MAEIVYLLETSPYDPATPGLKTVNFSSNLLEETVSGATTPYPVRLISVYSHESSVYENNLPGQANVSIGTSVINNADGRFDYLINYNWDNRDVTIKRGERGAAYGTFTTEFVGKTVELNADSGNLVLVMKDNGLKLAKPMQANKFAGTSGAEGGLELKGRTKPLLYSDVRNASPVLLDSTKLTYQLHDGALTSVSAVYDKANPIAFSANYASYALLVAATIPPGSYATYLAGGYIRLGAPPVGIVTVDAQGPKYSVYLATQAYEMIKALGGLVAGDFDTAAITTLDTDFPYVYEGLYFPEPELQLDEFLEIIATSMDAFWYVTRAGLIKIQQFKFRTTSATIRQEDLLALGRASSPMPVRRVRVNYAKNATVQSVSDFVIPRQTFNGLLTKSHQFIQTAADGSGGVYTTDAIFKVFLNDTEINDFGIAQFSVITTSAWLAIDANGVISITDPGVTSVTGTLRANLGEFSVDMEFTVTRSLGTLKTITLTPNRNHVLIDDAGALVGNQDVDMTTTVVGTTLTTITGTDNLGTTYNPTNLGGGVYRIAASTVSNNPLVFWVKWVASDAAGIKQTRFTNIRRGTDAYAASILSAYAVGDGAISLFYQTTAPLAIDSQVDDLWFDTDDSNKIYRYDGASWGLVADTRIPTALSNAATAQSTADTKVKTFFAPTGSPPTPTTVGDLWYNTTTKLLKRWDGASWVDVSNLVLQGSDIGVSNGATADLKLTELVGGGATITGNTVVANTFGGYNSTVVGAALYGPCFAECDVITTGTDYTILALDDDATNYSYIALSVTVHYHYATGGLAIYGRNDGTQLHSSTPGVIAGKMALVFDGVSVRVFIGGVERAKIVAPTGLTGAIWPKFDPYGSVGVGCTMTGCRAGYFTDNNFASIGGATRPSDYAGTTNNLAMFVNGAGAGERQGNKLTKTGGASAWDTGWVTAEATKGNGILSVKVVTASLHAHVALVLAAARTSPLSGYGLYFDANGSVYVSNSGSSGGALSAYVVGDVFSVDYDGISMRYYRNGGLIHTSVPSITYETGTLFGQVSIYTPNATLSDFIFMPSTANNFASIGGATRPSDYAGTTNTLIAVGNVSRVGNTLTKTGAVGGNWDAGYYTGEASRGNGLVSYKVNNVDRDQMTLIIPVANRETPISNGIGIFQSGPNVYLYQGGVGSLATLGTCVVGDFLSLSYDGVTARAFKNGAVFGTPYAFSTFATDDLVGQVAFSTLNASVSEFSFQSTSANNFSLVGGATRPSDYAGTTLTFTTTGGATVVGNSVTPAGGTAASKQFYAGGLSFSGRFAVDGYGGFKINLGGFDYGFKRETDGFLYAYHGGNNIAAGSPDSTAIFTFIYDGLAAYFYKNATLLGSVPQGGSGLPLTQLAVFGNNPAVISDLQFAPNNNAAWFALGGSGKPADNAGSVGALTPLLLGAGATTIVGNTITKTNAAASWDVGAYGSPLRGSAFIRGRLVSGGVIGLGTTVTGLADTIGDPVEFWCLYWNGGSWQYNASYPCVTSAGAAMGTVNSTVEVRYDGRQVVHLIDGVPVQHVTNGGTVTIKSVAATVDTQPIGRTYYPRVALYGQNWVAKEIVWGNYIENTAANLGWDFRTYGTASLEQQGNGYKQTSHTANFQTLMSSREKFMRTAYVTGRMRMTSGFFGLRSSVTNFNGSDYLSGTDYCLYWNGANWSWQADGNSLGSYTINSVPLVTYDGTTIKAYLDGSLVKTVTGLAEGLGFYIVAGVVSTGNQISDLSGGFFTENVWSAIQGANRPSDNAGSTLTFAHGGGTSTNYTVTGNKVTQNAAGGWALWLYSDQSFVGTAMVSGRFTGNLTSGGNGPLLGLATPANALLTNYTTTDYGFFFVNGTMFYSELGSYASLGVSAAPTDVFTLTYDGVNVRYYKNETLLRTVATTSGRTFRAKITFDAMNGSTFISDIQFAPYTDNNFASIGGATRPSDNATADMVFTSIGSQSVTIVGNSFSRIAGVDNYDAAVRGEPLIGTAYAEAEIIQTASAYTMISLDGAEAGTAFAGMDITLHFQRSTGGYQCYLAGVQQFTGTLATNLTGKIALSYDGIRFRAYVAGTQVGTDIATTAGQTLWPKWHDYTGGAALRPKGLRSLPFTDNVWSSIGGTGKAADNATVNIITRSSSAPGSPVNGDVWVDTSVTPNLTKVRVAGAWQVGANYTTEGSHIGVENAADITGAVVGSAALTVMCDYTGVAKTGQLPKTSGYKLYKAGTDVTTSASWTRTLLTGTCTSTVGAATGELSVSAISTNCRIRLDSAYGGKTYSFTVDVYRELDPAPTGGSPGGGTSASVNITGSVTSTTHAAISATDLYVKAGTNGQIALTGGGGFYHNTTAASLHVYTIIQKWNGSAWVDLGTETQSTEPSRYYSTDYIWEDGVWGSTYTDTGLTAGVEYRYRLTGRTASGTVARYFLDQLTGVGT